MSAITGWTELDDQVVAHARALAADAVQKVANQLSKNSYGQYLTKMLLELSTSAQPMSLSAKVRP